MQKLKEQAYNKNDAAAAARRRGLNDRMMLAERGFLDSEGIKGKEWFKHLVSKLETSFCFFFKSEFTTFPNTYVTLCLHVYVKVYGPAAEPESKLGFFPGIADAIAVNSSEGMIQHEIWRVARAIQKASRALKGGFT